MLIDWSSLYDHLREVTPGDVLAQFDAVHGSRRERTLIVLRPLSSRAEENDTVFKNSTARTLLVEPSAGVSTSYASCPRT